MKIHIVRYKSNSDSILSRKAKVLATRLGWSIGSLADSGADVNYSFPYLDYRRNVTTPLAAYFTHREDVLPNKVEIWKNQARKALLRITSAQQYYEDLLQYGPTVKILPPLDRDKFQPGSVKKGRLNRIPVLGVSGYVYKGGRKGEDLVRQALKEGDYEWRGMGKGWPVPTKEYPYSKIQEFYQGLDILVCPATIEGVPYPPIEALACGTKIVIPRGVGLLDELPDLPGIERYNAGDWKDMMKAIDRCVAAEASPEDLRSATEPFTDQNWVEEHEKAFEELEKVMKQTGKQVNRRTDRGIYISAYGSPARSCAKRLIKSIRENMPDTQVAVVSDYDMPEADYQIQSPINADECGRVGKLNAYNLAPWEKVIYLDVDTELTESIEYLFWCLDQGWEMVLVKDINSRHTVRYLRRDKAVQEYAETLKMVGSDKELALAGGVWAFKRCKGAKAFMDTWLREWGDGRFRDQPAMLRAFYIAKVKAVFLGNEWNSFTNSRRENRYEIVRHYSRGQARIHNNLLGDERNVTVINRSDKAVERGGYLFLPDSPALVKKNSSRFNEIKACNDLEVIKE